MFKNESLKDIERRAYRSTFDDGIYDIQFGLIFLILAWIPMLESVGIPRVPAYILLIMTPILLPWLGKRFITIPRMGSVEFGTKRKSRKRFTLLIGLGTIILMLPLIIMILSNNVSGQLGWPMIAIFMAPVVVIAIYALDFPRLFLYAALLLIGIVEAEFLLPIVKAPFHAIVSFGLPGIIIMTIGLTLLVKFIQKYPKATPEAPHVV